MSEKIIGCLVVFVTHVIDAGGYAGIVALLAINSACIPLPSELIMPFSGYLVYLGRFNLLLVALAVALVGGVGGCGSSQAGPPTTTTTGTDPYAGVYVVTVVGTYTVSSSQTIQQSTTLTYEIN